MALEPVEATLIAASVGALASTAGVLLNNRLTRERERQYRVWERRMNTYQEVLRTRQMLARHRAELLRTQSSKMDFIDPEKELNAISLTRVQLDMFGTFGIRTVDMLVWVAFNNWARTVSEWRELHARATAHLHDQDLWGEADKKWAEIKDLSKTLDLADTRLTEAIREEADFKEYGTRTRRERLKAGLQRLRVRPRPIESEETAPPTPAA